MYEFASLMNNNQFLLLAGLKEAQVHIIPLQAQGLGVYTPNP